MFNTLFPENRAVYELVRKCKTERERERERQGPQTIKRHMRFECWITKTTNTHSEYVYLWLFRYINSNTNAPQCYVIRRLPVFLISKFRCVLYVFFWVIPRRLNFICRRFGTLFLSHLHRQVGLHLPAYEDGTDRVFRNVGM